MAASFFYMCDMNASAGSSATSRAVAREEQLNLLKVAELACQKAEHEARSTVSHSSAAASAEPNTVLIQELEAVSDNFVGLRKLIENQEVSLHQNCGLPLTVHLPY